MAFLRLDGAGQAKMTTLDDALVLHQRIHGLVESYALSVTQNKPAGSILQNLRRQLPMLAAKLKGQFGTVSDLVTSVNVQATRGASEQMRVRGLREGIAAIRVQLDIAVAQTTARHAEKDMKDQKAKEDQQPSG